MFFRQKHTLYDIDDAEHTRHPVKTIHHFMRRCWACSAGSESLVQYIRQFNSNVFFLSSPVIDHGLTKSELENTFTVGWIGYYGAHRQSLTELFFPALCHIDFPLKLILLGVATESEQQEIRSYFKNNENISVKTPLHLKWLHEHSIYEIIKTFDIGISPLVDTEFNRAKSAFKLKQCLSCGVPVLGSSVGENKAFLKDGLNGYFCDNPNDYLQRLIEIKYSRPDCYSKLSINAKASFPAFSIDNYCSTFIRIFKMTADN